MPKRSLLLLTLVTVLLLLAACAQGAGPETDLQATAETVIQTVVETVVVQETVMVEGTPEVVERVVTQQVVVTATPAAEEEEEASTGDARRAESLNVALGGRIADPTNLNLYAPGVSRSGTGLHQVAYEYLFYYNLQTGEFIPWLAEGYEYNDDYTALTVTLRDGVTWNDGEPFTADDIVFTYALLAENPSMSWAAEATTWVESAEAIDPLTVQINLTEPNPRFHLIREAFPAVGIWGGLTILPQHIWENEDPLTFKNTPLVTTGPYRLANATETAISYERRDDWWGTEVFGITPGPKYVNFQYVGPETNTALALAANELDTPNIGILSPGSYAEVARRNPNVIAWSEDEPQAWLDPCPRALMVQNAHAPWDNADARWGLSYLIDRQAIVNLAYEGATVPSWGIWPYYNAMEPYFESIDGLLEQYPTTLYDPAQAEARFGAAGITKQGDQWTTEDGQPLRVVYLVNADNNEEMKVSTVLADQLTAEGIEVELQPLSGGVLNDAILRGNYDIKFHPFCPGYIYDNLALFHSQYYVPLDEAAPWYERNSFRYQNEAFDAVVDEMGAVPPDQEEQLAELFPQAMEIWLQDLPVLPMVQAPALVPFNTTYWEGWPTADNPWNMPVSWWATFNLVISGYPSADGDWVGGIRSTQTGGQ